MSTGFGRFRLRVVATMMLVVAALTTLGLYIAQRHVAEEAENQLQREFSAALERIERELVMRALCERRIGNREK